MNKKSPKRAFFFLSVCVSEVYEVNLDQAGRGFTHKSLNVLFTANQTEEML